MSKLPYLVQEVNAAIEVYLSGRTGQQYNRTAYVLCDDCAELASKLYLITHNANWSDTKANGHFKRFNEVTAEVRTEVAARQAADHARVSALLALIEGRRGRRNEFFHSTHLLDLNLHGRDCVEALVDVLDYGRLLFGPAWDAAVTATGNMETCEVLLRLDKKTYADPSVLPKVNAILARWPRLAGRPPTGSGCEITHHPEDHHLRLAIRNGGKTLRDRLRVLL